MSPTIACVYALPVLFLFGFVYTPSVPAEPSSAILPTLARGLILPALSAALSVLGAALGWADPLVLGLMFGALCSGVLVLGTVVRLGLAIVFLFLYLLRSNRSHNGGDLRRFLRFLRRRPGTVRGVESGADARFNAGLEIVLQQFEPGRKLSGRHRSR